MKKLLILLFILAIPAISTPAFSACKKHVELLSMDDWMREMGWNWMQAGAHRINLWDSPSRGRVVGKLMPGTRAVILERAEGHYKIKAPEGQGGGSGWIGDIQVKRTLMQDDVKSELCKKPK